MSESSEITLSQEWCSEQEDRFENWEDVKRYILHHNHVTMNRKWCREQTNRLASWEILRRHVLHQTRLPMTNEEICDTIGVSSSYTIRLLKGIQKRINTEDAE
jgi:hypothetical protein